MPDDNVEILADDAQLPIDSAAIHAVGAQIPLARALDPSARRSIASARRAFLVAHRFLPAYSGSNPADGTPSTSDDSFLPSRAMLSLASVASSATGVDLEMRTPVR